jgi:hypothetical protein
MAPPGPSPVPATSSPIVSGRAVKDLSTGGTTVFPGTYATLFHPELTLTIGNVVNLDCAPGYRCRGEVDLNSANFLDLEFGNVHGSEVHIIRLDKVYDPAKPGKVINPPGDLAAWIEALPGTAVLAPAKTAMIGGMPAVEFDARTPGEMWLGPLPGGPNDTADPAGPRAGIGPSALRIILVTHSDAYLVLITEWLGPENTVRNGADALKSLQPLIDSITWLQ